MKFISTGRTSQQHLSLRSFFEETVKRTDYFQVFSPPKHMASTSTSKEGSLTHCILVLEMLQLPLKSMMSSSPSSSILPSSPFPSAMQTSLQVLPQLSPPSCLSLPGTPPPPPWQPPQHILGGREMGNTAHSWQEGGWAGVRVSQPQPPSYSLFRFLSSRVSLLH